MRRALLVRVDGTTEVVDLDAGDPATLIRGAIGCQWFEVVRVTPEIYLWVDEEGRLNGKRPNLAACWLTAAGDQRVRAQVYVGDALFTGGVDGKGESLGLTDQQVDALRGWLSLAPVSP